MLARLFPLTLLACSTAPRSPEAAKPAQLVLLGGETGIGFDDLRFSPQLHRVLAPAGRTGKLDLINLETRAIESVDGFSSEATFGGGISAGVGSTAGASRVPLARRLPR